MSGLRLFIVGFFILFSTLGAVANEENSPEPDKSLRGGMQELSAMQAMLEFFFMEAGVYPPTLKELNLAFNAELPRGARPVPLPKDPATGKEFVYRAAENRKGYTISFPDPSKYGLAADFELRPVSWGWLALRAEQRRFEEMVKLSKFHIETIATQVEMYAKDNQGTFPQTLDDLYPEYIKRHPQDPVTGKNYTYKQLADGYIVASPNPERYGLKIFQYSSSKGIQVEVLPPEN
ncbi:MAG: hypothetical protein WC314_09000 [Vulcanimicrobiota bacterium]